MPEDQDRNKQDLQDDEGYIPPRNQHPYQSDRADQGCWGEQPGLDGDELNYGFFQDQQRAAEAGFQQPPFGRFPVLNPCCPCAVASPHHRGYRNTPPCGHPSQHHFTPGPGGFNGQHRPTPYAAPEPPVALTKECAATIKNAADAAVVSLDTYLSVTKAGCRDGGSSVKPVRELQAKLWLATVDRPACYYLNGYDWIDHTGTMALNNLAMFANANSEMAELAKTILLALFTFLELNDESIGLSYVTTYFKVSRLDLTRFL